MLRCQSSAGPGDEGFVPCKIVFHFITQTAVFLKVLVLMHSWRSYFICCVNIMQQAKQLLSMVSRLCFGKAGTRLCT